MEDSAIERRGPLPTAKNHPPPRNCDRMIRLTSEILSNCRNVELRGMLIILQNNLAPAAKELDKWVIAYTSYQLRYAGDTGLLALHQQIMDGDKEIAAYVLNEVETYRKWCSDQCTWTSHPPSSVANLSEGFWLEDLRKLNNLENELQGYWHLKFENKGRAGRSTGPKRKRVHQSPATDIANGQIPKKSAIEILDLKSNDSVETPLRFPSRKQCYPPSYAVSGPVQQGPSKRQSQVISLLDSDTDSSSPPSRSATRSQSLPFRETTSVPRQHGSTKRDPMPPANLDVAPHAAEYILRAYGRHPEKPGLNAALDDMLPKKLSHMTKDARAAGESLPDFQARMIQEARDYFEAKDKAAGRETTWDLNELKALQKGKRRA